MQIVKIILLAGCLFFGISNPAFSQKFMAIDYLFTIGEPGDSLAQFQHPQGMAIGPGGNIYVADSGNNRVQRFDAAGQFIDYIGGLGSGSEQYDTPTDICAQDGLNVYVTDYNNNRIHHLNRRLVEIAAFSGTSLQQIDYQFLFPQSIAVAMQGDIFIIEREKNSVIKFNSFFSPVVRFGSIETGEGILNRPEKIELVADKYVGVTDSQAGRIALFDYFGNFIKYIGEKDLHYPVGLFYWSSQNQLIVSDLKPAKIFAFSLDGESSEFKLLQKNEAFKWQAPVDLAVKQDRLFVLDQEKQKIFVYRILSKE